MFFFKLNLRVQVLGVSLEHVVDPVTFTSLEIEAFRGTFRRKIHQ